MNGESFRFIHASDFHLERPLGDLDNIPKHLREPMAGAAWKAATTVFETAIVASVDFVLLSGDLTHPLTAGPRGIAMLMEQFELLHEHGIQVFWSTGVSDDIAAMGDVLGLPPNVTVFPKDRAEQAYVRRSGDTIAVVVGRSSDGRSGLHVPSFRHDPTDLFTVALGYGNSEASTLADSSFDYWALGGQHNRRTLDGVASVGAAFCGSPQGRSLTESGAHGFHLVDIDADGTSRVHFVESDSFRYIQVELGPSDIGHTSDLKGVLSQRMSRLLHENGDRHLLIGWRIQLSAETPMGVGDPTDLLMWLRNEYGHGNPAAWSIDLDIAAPPQFPESWREEDTILGDYLRAAGEHRKTGAREIDLEPLTEEHTEMTPGLAQALAEVDPSARSGLLDHATLLGVEMLRGGRPHLATVGDSREY